jgi:sporulation protein YtfJ
MSEHPIQSFMETAMKNLREMIDVNTIVGDAIETPDGTIIIPVSKVSFGFGSGGSEFEGKNTNQDNNYPFGGGCGGGVSIQPIAFMVVSKDNVKLVSVGKSSSSLNKVLDLVPDLISKFTDGNKKSIKINKNFNKKSEDNSENDDE